MRNWLPIFIFCYFLIIASVIGIFFSDLNVSGDHFDRRELTSYIGWFILGILLVPILVIFNELEKRKRKRNKAKVQSASDLDPTWNIDNLELISERIYLATIKAWNDNNSSHIEKFTTSAFQKKLHVRIEYLKDIGRKRVFERVEIESIDFSKIKDYDDDSRDTFEANISASFDEFDLNLKTGKRYADGSPKIGGVHRLKFIRVGDKWITDEFSLNS